MMLETLNQWDITLFEILNGIHADWADPLMQALSSRGLWVPGYMAIAWYLFRSKGWKDLLLFGIITGLMVVLADQIASGIIKPWAQRFRPCQLEAGLDFVVHTVEGKCGGKYGFVSSHAANFFTMATLFSLRIPIKPWPWVFFLLACIAGYSRIYLGVHYPGDVLVGAMVGLCCASIGWGIYRKMQHIVGLT